MDLNALTLGGTCGVSWIVEAQKQKNTYLYFRNLAEKYLNIIYFYFIILVFLKVKFLKKTFRSCET